MLLSYQDSVPKDLGTLKRLNVSPVGEVFSGCSVKKWAVTMIPADESDLQKLEYR